MPYTDFTDTEWIVKSAGPEALCSGGQKVVFRGPEKSVEIRCETKTPYREAAYDETSNTIARKDEFTITIDVKAKPRVISFSCDDGSIGSIGGSWTADDNTAQPGGD